MKKKLYDISEKKIKGNRIGIFFGTVSPLHQGHYSEIIRAKRENDGCIVIVSGYTGDRGDNAGMNLTHVVGVPVKFSPKTITFRSAM